MEAKDRLVGELRIHSILADERNKLNRSIIRAMKQLRKEQDEISFKAGYEEGMKSQKTPRTDLECGLADEEFRKEFHIARKETDMEMYKAGIKEVVEWIENNKLFALVPSPKEFIIGWQDWQAKLKEWGIEEPQESSTSPKE